MPWGFAAAAVASIAGAVIGSNASQDAAKTQASAANSATDLQRQIFQQSQQNAQPFIAGGANSLSALNKYIGVTPGGGFDQTAPGVAPFTADKFQSSPGYQFQMQQGTEAILNNASALGGVQSGNTLKALDQFGQGIANQDWWNAYNAYTQQQQQTIGALQFGAGLGANSAAGQATNATNAGTQIGNNIIGAGNAKAAGTIGGANALSGGVNNLASLAFLYGQNGGGGGGSTSGQFGGFNNQADFNSTYPQGI